tara:strand:- start:151 stop:504 length:354 start_codon:yes stop_codon:yes gene_type:complete
MKTFLTLIFFLIIHNSVIAYGGSNQTGQVGFWHASTIDRIQLGWDERIYIYLDNNHNCLGKGSDLIFYHPTARGRQMILSALLANDASKEVNFRIDSCHETGGGVIYGYFDKIAIKF